MAKSHDHQLARNGQLCSVRRDDAHQAVES